MSWNVQDIMPNRQGDDRTSVRQCDLEFLADAIAARGGTAPSVAASNLSALQLQAVAAAISGLASLPWITSAYALDSVKKNSGNATASPAPQPVSGWGTDAGAVASGGNLLASALSAMYADVTKMRRFASAAVTPSLANLHYTEIESYPGIVSALAGDAVLFLDDTYIGNEPGHTMTGAMDSRKPSAGYVSFPLPSGVTVGGVDAVVRFQVHFHESYSQASGIAYEYLRGPIEEYALCKAAATVEDGEGRISAAALVSALTALCSAYDFPITHQPTAHSCYAYAWVAVVSVVSVTPIVTIGGDTAI